MAAYDGTDEGTWTTNKEEEDCW